MFLRLCGERDFEFLKAMDMWKMRKTIVNLFLFFFACLLWVGDEEVSEGAMVLEFYSVDAAGGAFSAASGQFEVRAAVESGAGVVMESSDATVDGGFLHDLSLTDYDFQDGAQGWSFVPTDIPYFPFSAPHHSESGGVLTLAPSDSNTFGYFESGFHTPLLAERVYQVSFAISSNMDTRRAIPRLRLRSALSDFQESASFDIISQGQGDASPTRTPLIYPLYFYPSQIAAADGATRTLGAFFDLIHIHDPEDSMNAEVYLHYLTIDVFSQADFSNVEVMRNYTFDQSAEGWTGKDMTGSGFTTPVYTYDGGRGRLAITVNDTTNNFGFWESPFATPEIPASSNKLYRATFTVATNNSQPLTMPKVRLRLYTENFQTATDISLEPRGTADIIPVAGNSRSYEVYLIPSPAALSVKCAFDIIALDDPAHPQTKNGTVVYLEHCIVERMDIPHP